MHSMDTSGGPCGRSLHRSPWRRSQGSQRAPRTSRAAGPCWAPGIPGKLWILWSLWMATATTDATDATDDGTFHGKLGVFTCTCVFYFFFCRLWDLTPKRNTDALKFSILFCKDIAGDMDTSMNKMLNTCL